MAAILHMYLEAKALDDYEKLQENGAEVDDWDKIKALLIDKFKGRKGNFRAVVSSLNNHPKMKPGQSISSYFHQLSSIVKQKQRDMDAKERETKISFSDRNY